MGARGPAPKPTALKVKQGNPGKRALNKAEPRVAGEGAIRPPAHLGDAARAEWARPRKKLAPVGLLTALDTGVLAAYCQAYTRWVEAEEQLSRFGPVVKTKNGNLVQNPYLAVANRAMEQMLVYARELGMTPSARSRIQLPSAPPGPSLAEELFRAAQEVYAERLKKHGSKVRLPSSTTPSAV
jgi:P27 family predicted phage terminase small subunit